MLTPSRNLQVSVVNLWLTADPTKHKASPPAPDWLTSSQYFPVMVVVTYAVRHVNLNFTPKGKDIILYIFVTKILP